MRCPALLVSAPASGQGKTTVVAALARLLTRHGARVRVFKCGPDFLDPFVDELASGHAVHSLDLWMTGEMDARARLHAEAMARREKHVAEARREILSHLCAQLVGELMPADPEAPAETDDPLAKAVNTLAAAVVAAVKE